MTTSRLFKTTLSIQTPLNSTQLKLLSLALLSSSLFEFVNKGEFTTTRIHYCLSRKGKATWMSQIKAVYET